jgi:hypothetical protein
MQQPIVSSQKFATISSHIFYSLPLKRHISFQNWLFGLSKWNDEHALDFVLHLSRLFRSPVSLDFPYTPHARFPATHFPEICTKFDVPLSYPSLNRVRPDTRLQINRHNNSALPPSCVKCCILNPKICQYHYLPFHRATTTVVQTTAPVPEIMDSQTAWVE